MIGESDETIVTLIAPDEYAARLNQVAGISGEHIVFVKRKFVSKAGYELTHHPIAACAKVRYFDERPALVLVTGAFLLAVAVAIVALLVLNWNDLSPGTRVPVGAIGLVGVFGVRRLLGARRHRLVFDMREGSRLTWRSAPGEFQNARASVNRIVELARDRGLLEGSRLVRT
jgi:hypothetical protein